MGEWTFFSNYGHVLVCLARNRQIRLRDVAAEVGITERAVQKIVRDLQDAGYLTVSKQGRCNRYQINRRKTLRHSLESHCTVGKLLTLISKPVRATSTLPQDQESTESPPAVSPSLVDGKRPAGDAPDQKPVKAAAKKKRAAEEESKSKPLDTRQQGTLF